MSEKMTDEEIFKYFDSMVVCDPDPNKESEPKIETTEINGVVWHNLSKYPKDYPPAEITIRVVTYGGDQYICETDWYEPSEDEIGYGHLLVSMYCNGECFDDSSVVLWSEIPKIDVEGI